jgi:hypothetical protein
MTPHQDACVSNSGHVGQEGGTHGQGYSTHLQQHGMLWQHTRIRWC